MFSNGLKPSCGRGLFLESWRHMCCTVLCLVAQSCLTLCDAMDHSPPGSSVHGDSPGKNTGMDCHALLQGIFPTQGSNPNLLHCSRILYHLNHLESPRILEWVTYPFSWDLPDRGIKLGSPALQVDSLPAELSRKSLGGTCVCPRYILFNLPKQIHLFLTRRK